jgi:hypothetical protein
VTDVRITQPAPRPNTREHRALELYRTRGDEIREIGTDVFEVPSCTGEGRYRVNYESETCSCMDHEYHPSRACKHILAVGILYAKAHRRVSIAGDPGQDHPHACLNGYIYLGYTALDEDTGEEVERVEALPCRRCASEASR